MVDSYSRKKVPPAPKQVAGYLRLQITYATLPPFNHSVPGDARWVSASHAVTRCSTVAVASFQVGLASSQHA